MRQSVRQTEAETIIQQARQARQVGPDIQEIVQPGLCRPGQIGGQERDRPRNPHNRQEGGRRQDASQRAGADPPWRSMRDQAQRGPGDGQNQQEQDGEPRGVECGEQPGVEQQCRHAGPAGGAPERLPAQRARRAGDQQDKRWQQHRCGKLRMTSLDQRVACRGDQERPKQAGRQGQQEDALCEHGKADAADTAHDQCGQIGGDERIDPGHAQRGRDRAKQKEPFAIAQRVRVGREIRHPVPIIQTGKDPVPMLDQAGGDDGVVRIAKQDGESVMDLLPEKPDRRDRGDDHPPHPSTATRHYRVSRYGSVPGKNMAEFCQPRPVCRRGGKTKKPPAFPRRL